MNKLIETSPMMERVLTPKHHGLDIWTRSHYKPNYLKFTADFIQQFVDDPITLKVDQLDYKMDILKKRNSEVTLGAIR